MNRGLVGPDAFAQTETGIFSARTAIGYLNRLGPSRRWPLCASPSRTERVDPPPTPETRQPLPPSPVSRVLDIMGLAHLFNISIKLYGPYMYINGFIPYGNLIESRLYLNT